MKTRTDAVLISIAIFRLAKAIGLVLAAIGLLRGGFIEHVVVTFTHLPPGRVHELAFAAFAYAALFTTEGIGLLTHQRWAEWLTIVATASFIPFEVIEVVRKVSFVRVSLLIANAAIVAYLLWRRIGESAK